MAYSSTLRLLSDNDVKQIAAFTIDRTYQLNDARFGSAGSMFFDCPLCHHSAESGDDSCIGHCASISLNCYIFHPMAYSYIISILNNMCIECKKLYHNTVKSCQYCKKRLYKNYTINTKETPHFVQRKTSQENEKKGSNKLRPIDIKDLPAEINTLANELPVALSNENVGSQLEGASEEAEASNEGSIIQRKYVTMQERGLIISQILVPPINMRTPYDIEWDSKLQFQYNQLVNIIKINFEEYFNEYVRRNKITYNNYTQLQYNQLLETIKTDNTNSRRYEDYVRQVSQRYKQIIGSSKQEGIMGLLGKKNGVFRHIMMGKRVDNCARAVISPDPTLALDEIFVPIKIASEIKITEHVSRFNQKKLCKMAEAGKLFWKDTDISAQRHHIVEGLSFQRYIIDGDYVLFNRQPSLTRTSILSFRIKVRRNKANTFGMNPQVVSMFNADFDGDEMNVFFGVSSSEYSVEMQFLLHVSNNVVVDDRVALIPVQDVVSGSYIMSLKDNPIEKSVAQQLLQHIDTLTLNSIMMSSSVKNVSLTKDEQNKLFCKSSDHNALPADEETQKISSESQRITWAKRVEESEKKALERPTKTDKVEESEKKALERLTRTDEVEESEKKALERLQDKGKQKMSSESQRPTRMSWADEVEESEKKALERPTKTDEVEESKRNISSIRKNTKAKVLGVGSLTSTYNYNNMTTWKILKACIPSYTNGCIITKEWLTKQIRISEKPLLMLQTLQNVVQIWLYHYGLSVNLLDVTTSATVKGISISQNMTFNQHCQNIIQNELADTDIMKIIKSGAKGTTIHLQNMAVALGQQIIAGKPGVFCNNSYSSGLSPDEFFGHQMAAREGVVNTGVTTAESGYLNRRACKIMGDVAKFANGVTGDKYSVISFP